MRLCVAVSEPTVEAARAAAGRACRWADLVEIRADAIRDLQVEALLGGKPCPILFTLRTRAEGGAYDGPEGARLETLCEAAQLGADYVDVEFSSYWKAVLDAVPKERVILSHHDFQGTPDDLTAVVDAMAATGAGVVKVATRARSLADNLTIERLLRHATECGIRLVALAMGREGIPSRVLGPSWGSWMTFASLPGSAGTADGQIPADVLLEHYRIRRIGPDTALYGVLGRPLGHSMSPLVHNAAFALASRDAVYLPLEAASAEDFDAFDAAHPLRGVSVTIPYKEVMHARAASLSVPAEVTGATNTLSRTARGWHGENTDVDGFLRPLIRRMHPGSVKAVVLGTGGAGRAAVCALRSQGASVTVVARNPAAAKALAERFDAASRAWSEIGSITWDLLVNTTPVGMHPDVDASPVAPDVLRAGAWVYDLVYNPTETRLLREARERGCRTIRGSEMFLAQALRQQQIWTGALPEAEPLRQLLDEALSARRAAAVEL